MADHTNTHWSRTTRYLVVIGAAIALIWLLIAARPLLGPLVLALLIAYFLAPPVNFLARRLRLPRIWAVRIVFFTALALVAGIPATAGTLIVRRLLSLKVDLLATASQLEELLLQPVTVFGLRLEPSWLAANIDLNAALSRLVGALPGGALNLIGGVGANLLWVLVVVAATYYLLAQGPSIRRGLAALAGPAHQPEWERLIGEVDEVWRVFLWGQLLVFAIMFFPTVGSVYGVIRLYQTGVIRLSPLGLIVVVALVYTLVQQIDTVWLRPHLFGQTLKIHPALVLIGLVAGGVIGGVIGLITIVPLMATTRVVGRYVHRKLLGLPLWPDEPAPAVEEAPVGEAPSTLPEAPPQPLVRGRVGMVYTKGRSWPELAPGVGQPSPTVKRRNPMATYILLSNVTEEGAETIRDNPGRIKEVNRELEALGVKVVAQYAVLGPYDFVNIVEAPNNETIARVSAELGARGSVKIMTMAAIPIDDFIASFG